MLTNHPQVEFFRSAQAGIFTVEFSIHYHRSGISEIYTVGLEKLVVEVTLAIEPVCIYLA